MKRYIYIIIGIVVAAVIAILVLIFIKDRSSNNITIGGVASSTGNLPAVGDNTNTNTNTTGGANTTGGSQTVGTTGANTNPSSVLNLPSISASSTTTVGGGGTYSQLTSGTFGILSTDPVVDYFVDAKDNIVALEATGAVITISNGQSSVISTSTINDIISASFSADGKKLLVSSGNPSNPQAQVFNVTTNSWTQLPQGMLSPQWAPTGYQVAYLANSGTGKLQLSMMNIATPKSGSATLLTLHANDMTMQWINKNDFVLSDKPSSDVNGSILVFNSSNGTLTPIPTQGYGIESAWSHNANPLGLIFSTQTGGQNPRLQLELTSGSALEKLTILTLPSKCVFGTATTSTAGLPLYCGIPRTSSNFSSANLPDDYNTLALFTSDDLYRIDTASGTTDDLLSDPNQNLDTSDVKTFNGVLFFINRYNQELYGLVLGQ